MRCYRGRNFWQVHFLAQPFWVVGFRADPRLSLGPFVCPIHFVLGILQFPIFPQPPSLSHPLLLSVFPTFIVDLGPHEGLWDSVH